MCLDIVFRTPPLPSSTTASNAGLIFTHVEQNHFFGRSCGLERQLAIGGNNDKETKEALAAPITFYLRSVLCYLIYVRGSQ